MTQNPANQITGNTVIEQTLTSYNEATKSAQAVLTTQMLPDKYGDWSKFYRLKWDAWNRLAQVKDTNEALVATYAYDGTTRRTTKTVSGTTTHFYYNDQWRPVEEREDASTNAESQYLWGNRYRDDLVLRDRDTNGSGTLDERLYVTHDYFNPTAILDTSGNVQERYGYSAFGVRRIMAADFADRATSSFDWEFGFQGQFRDSETGFYNYGYRYYSPKIGRWTSRDPIKEIGAPNLYEFVNNSPFVYVDFLGLTDDAGKSLKNYCTITIAVGHSVSTTGENIENMLGPRDGLERDLTNSDRIACVTCSRLNSNSKQKDKGRYVPDHNKTRTDGYIFPGTEQAMKGHDQYDANRSDKTVSGAYAKEFANAQKEAVDLCKTCCRYGVAIFARGIDLDGDNWLAAVLFRNQATPGAVVARYHCVTKKWEIVFPIPPIR